MNTFKILIHTVSIFVLSTFLFSQEAVELKEKRTINSKTYDNGNGSYTLEISLDNLHYKDEKGEFKEIKKDFTASLKEDYSYEVAEGLYKVYIKKQSKEKKTQRFLTREGNEINLSLNAMGYYSKSSGEFKVIREIEDVKLQINKNKAIYKDIIKGIDVEYIYQSDRLKENIYVSQKARDDLPDPSEYGFKAEDTWLMFRSELDHSEELYVFQDNKDITGQDYETTSRLAFNMSEGETAFYFANDLASFIPEKDDPELEEEISVLKRIYSVGEEQNILCGVPLKWITGLPAGEVIIDPTVVLNTPQTCQDAYVYKWNGDISGTIHTNYGSSGALLADTWTKNGLLRYYRSYIKFDFSALPAQAKITSAQLTLTADVYPHAGGTASRYENAKTFLSRVTEPWNEYQVTWDNQPQVNANNQVDVDAPSDAYASMDEDVTALVKDILNSEEGNHGFQLKLQQEVVYNQVRYASTQNTDSNRWPKLTITYTEMQEAFYLKDHLGNIRVTLDGNGEVITTDDYYPFGLQMPGRSFNIALTGDLYKYNSKELDKEGGLNWQYYNPWRFRDPVTTRWLVVDPLYADYPSLSPYVYVANNPIILIDPDGRWFTHWDDENGAYSDVGVGESHRYSDYDYEHQHEVNPYWTPPIISEAERYSPSHANPLGWISWLIFGNNNYYEVLFDKQAGMVALASVPIVFLPGTGATKSITSSIKTVAIGFAKGVGKSVLNPNRLQHAARHLIKAKLLPAWSKATKVKFEKLVVDIVENPLKTIDHTMRGCTPAKGFVGNVNGREVVVYIAKEGGQVTAGDIITVVPR